MGHVYLDIKIVGTRKSKVVTALFDSGAYRNYIRSENMYDGETPDDIGFHVFEGTEDVFPADGRPVKVDLIRFKKVSFNGITIEEPLFCVMRDLNWDAIVGVEIMQKFGIILDLENHRIIKK